MAEENLKKEIVDGVQELFKKQNEDVKKLLEDQTVVILDAVDEKISKIERRIEQLDLKFSEKIDSLTNTLDAFLKRMTDMETEFEMMKEDLKRVKQIIREKLGVDLV